MSMLSAADIANQLYQIETTTTPPLEGVGFVSPGFDYLAEVSGRMAPDLPSGYLPSGFAATDASVSSASLYLDHARAFSADLEALSSTYASVGGVHPSEAPSAPSLGLTSWVVSNRFNIGIYSPA